jgi:hypothetical protein
MHGVFSFLLGGARRSAYVLHGVCALVENPAVFGNFEQLGLEAGCVLYGEGRASQRLLDWVAEQSAPDFSLVYLPDYDPVGLAEFVRLRERLGPRVQLHLPDDLSARFAAFSKPSLLDHAGSREMLVRLRGNEAAEIRQVAALIDQRHGGLEQEALLIPMA